MKLQLIKGRFDKEETIELLTRLIQVKIQFHEKKIQDCQREEDIKMREQRIKQLQKEFYDFRQHILSNGPHCELNADIQIQEP